MVWKMIFPATVEYEWLQENLPNICPKSISGYTRGKKAKSKKYLELKEAALALGMVLDDENYKKSTYCSEIINE